MYQKCAYGIIDFTRKEDKISLLVIISDIIYRSRRISLEILLTLGHEPLQALDVFPLRFIVQNVCNMFAEIENNY
jgi:hypothetical protein